MVQVKGSPASAISVASVAKRADSPLVMATVDEGPKMTSTPYRGTIIGSVTMNPTFSPIPAGAMFVEVEVDTETGEVHVDRVVYAHDIGRVINPMGAEGQVEGGLQQGIGYTLMEHTHFDPDNGTCLNGDFLDYKMPTSMEMPRKIESIFIESMEETGPFGAKSLSECCIIAPPGAIANAVYNAVGVRIRDLPITPEKILAALGKL
jgi:CO/xanthine dehydrogenase Mo-binding subunit